MREPEAAQDTLRCLHDPRTQHRVHARRRGEAHERHRARVHQLIGHAEQLHPAVVQVSVDIDLAAFDQLLDDQVPRAHLELREARQRLVVRLDEPADDVLLPRVEAQVLHQRLGRVAAARQHREGRLHRLHEQRVREPPGLFQADRVRNELEPRAQLRGDLAQAQPRLVLVLRPQERHRVGTRQAQPLGHQRRRQGTELLVGAEHRVDPAAIALDHAVDEAPQVEPHQPSVAREAEQVEAVLVEAIAAGTLVARQQPLFPVGAEEDQHAGRRRGQRHRAQRDRRGQRGGVGEARHAERVLQAHDPPYAAAAVADASFTAPPT